MSKTLQVNGEFLQNRQGVVYLIGSQGKSKAPTAYLFSKYTKNDFWIGSAWTWYKILKVQETKPFPSSFVPVPQFSTLEAATGKCLLIF